jgi:cell division septation protein DedD
MTPNEARNPTRELLLGEHKEILRSAERARVVNRALLTGIALLSLLTGFASSRLNLGVLAIGTLVSTFWGLQELMFRRNINRLEELVIEAYSQSLDKPEPLRQQKVLTKPAEGPPHPEQPSQPNKSELWVDTYVSWRHERWVNARFEIAQSLEPAAWVVLLVALVIARTMGL